MTTLPPPPPDSKDWTWVLEKPCSDCGFDQATCHHQDFVRRIEETTEFWRTRLSNPDVRDRPNPQVWSPVEYGCHVRDVFAVFGRRYRQMLDSAGNVPVQYGNWDQDAAAVDGDYLAQDPARVVEGLAAGARDVGALLRTVEGSAWEKSGLRGDGTLFTVDTLTRYLLHDLIHHEWDVRR